MHNSALYNLTKPYLCSGDSVACFTDEFFCCLDTLLSYQPSMCGHSAASPHPCVCVSVGQSVSRSIEFISRATSSIRSIGAILLRCIKIVGPPGWLHNDVFCTSYFSPYGQGGVFKLITDRHRDLWSHMLWGKFKR